MFWSLLFPNAVPTICSPQRQQSIKHVHGIRRPPLLTARGKVLIRRTECKHVKVQSRDFSLKSQVFDPSEIEVRSVTRLCYITQCKLSHHVLVSVSERREGSFKKI